MLCSDKSKRVFRLPPRSQGPVGHSEASGHDIDRPTVLSRIFRRRPRGNSTNVAPREINSDRSDATRFPPARSRESFLYEGTSAADLMERPECAIDQKYYQDLPGHGNHYPGSQMTNVPTNRPFQMPPSLVNVPPRRSEKRTFAELVEKWKTRHNPQTTRLAPSKEPRLYTEVEVGDIVIDILSQYVQSLAYQGPVTHRSGPSVFGAPPQTQACTILLVPIGTAGASRAYGMPVPSMATPSVCTHSTSQQHYGPTFPSRNNSHMQAPLAQRNIPPGRIVTCDGMTAFSSVPLQQQGYAPSLMASGLPSANPQFSPSLRRQTASC